MFTMLQTSKIHQRHHGDSTVNTHTDRHTHIQWHTHKQKCTHIMFTLLQAREIHQRHHGDSGANHVWIEQINVQVLISEKGHGCSNFSFRELLLICWSVPTSTTPVQALTQSSSYHDIMVTMLQNLKLIIYNLHTQRKRHYRSSMTPICTHMQQINQ